MLERFFFFVLFLSSLSFANSIEINEKLTEININNSVRVYKDSSGTLETKDIINAKALGIQEEKLNPISSMYAGVYWFCIDIENSSDKRIEWVFSIPKANAPGTIYFINQDGKEEKVTLSDSHVFLNYPAIAYTVTSQPKEKSILILKLSFKDGYFVFPQFDIVAKELFSKQTIINTMAKSMAFGAIAILFAYNLFLFFSFKTKAYGWYCLYMLLVALLFLGNSGIGYQFLWEESAFISKNIFAITYPLMFAAALQFSKEFLKTKERFLFLNKLLNIFSILFIVLLFVFILGFKIDAIKIFSISSLVMSLLPFLGLYTWQKGYKEARFYTFAWSAWAIGMTPLMLLMLGVDIQLETVVSSARIGIILESILLSFALADQINILRNQKDEAVAKYESQRALLEINSRQAQMGEMISAIIHQSKQPLNLLMLMLKEIQMIAAEYNNKIPKEINAVISNMEPVVMGMSSTMDDFKNFFSPSKNKTIFSPALTIQSILSMFGKQYEYDNIVFEVNESDKLVVIGKENELKQVLLNLFNNAKDAFCTNNIKDRKIEVTIKKEDASVVMLIKDNAGGIADNILNKVFEQHYTTKGDNGSGIGLYICKKIIEESFSGKINVKNTGNGVVFSIELPAANEPKETLSH